jgi:hypothetical protein
MKKCKSCLSEIDSKAKKCAKCGTDQRNWFGRHKILTGILVVIIFFAIVGSTGSKNGTTDTNSSTSNSQTASPSSKSEPTATSVEKQANVPAEYKSALNKATTYANTMHMSKRGVYDQLTSAYGEKFSAEAAQYAVDNVKADWNANALAKAKTYQDTMSMSPSAIHDQLTSDAGEKFTQAEADYAIQNLSQ